MRLDRNKNPDGRGKYALIKLRVAESVKWDDGGICQVPAKAIDFGDTEQTEFFVIRLKDKYAYAALSAYAKAAGKDDPEYAADVSELAELAANHPFKKIPD